MPYTDSSAFVYHPFFRVLLIGNFPFLSCVVTDATFFIACIIYLTNFVTSSTGRGAGVRKLVPPSPSPSLHPHKPEFKDAVCTCDLCTSSGECQSYVISSCRLFVYVCVLVCLCLCLFVCENGGLYV